MRPNHVRTLLIVTLAAACREAAPAPESFVARDSAGVRIVEHASFDALPVRGVSEPVVTIGSAMGDEAQQLDRVGGGAVLSDGRIALLNGGTAEVRFYDAGGALIATQGRSGDGPGEYRAPFFMYRMGGDSLLVWDVALRRGTVVTPDATVGRTIVLSESEGPYMPVGVFAGSELLVVQRIPGFDPAQITITSPERQIDHRYSAEGGSLAELGERGGRTVMLTRGGFVPFTDEVRPDPREGMNIGDTPFGSSTQRATAGDGYWMGDQKAREVTFLDRSGAPRTIVRWEGPPLTVTDADKNSYVEAQIEAARTEEVKAAFRTVPLEAFQFPETFPAHGPLVVATDGALWMSDYRRPGEGESRWTVFGSDGVARERIALPAGATVLWASGDRVLLRLEDELGVQRVELREVLGAGTAAP
jgi:hypothetical protein